MWEARIRAYGAQCRQAGAAEMREAAVTGLRNACSRLIAEKTADLSPIPAWEWAILAILELPLPPAAEAASPAAGWRPIETAPKADRYASYDDRRLLLLTDNRCKIGVWDDDRHAKKPRPFWAFEGDRISDSRAKQPTHWIPLTPAPTEEARAG